MFFKSFHPPSKANELNAMPRSVLLYSTRLSDGALNEHRSLGNAFFDDASRVLPLERFAFNALHGERVKHRWADDEQHIYPFFVLRRGNVRTEGKTVRE